ncbi:MAG: type II toxin-antitoxin system VapC family toxin [Cyanobacteria bacterium J06642_11]
MIVILDTGILSLLCHPNSDKNPEVHQCLNWFQSSLMKGQLPVSSAICEYELRRKLIQQSLKGEHLPAKALEKLDSLLEFIDFLSVTRDVLVNAAEIWAELRNSGQATASDTNLDADCILGAHYRLSKKESPGRKIIIVTTNVRHLNRFADAKSLQDIAS